MLGTNVLLVLSLTAYVTVEGRNSVTSRCPVRNGVYPIASSNCKQYVVCKEGIPYPKTCSPGLAYNPAKRSCDFDVNVRCKSVLTPPPVRAPAPQQVTCPTRNGTYPVSCDDCRKYIICQEGRPTQMECPPGLAFDQNKHSCDWAPKVACNRNIAPPRAPVQFNCQQRNGYTAVPNKCDAYIICQNYEAHEVSCPHGLQFNPEARWPENACTESPRYKSNVSVEQYQQPIFEYPVHHGDFSMGSHHGAPDRHGSNQWQFLRHHI